MSESKADPISPKALWTGRIMTALPVLFLLMDGVMKLIKPAVVVDTTKQLGYPESVILPLGVVLLACTIVYLVPRTAVLGAILLTGYLGGAVATHVRYGNGAFEILFPVIIGALLWGGLYLREKRLQPLIPLITQASTSTKKMLWLGRIVSALPVLMLLFSAVIKLLKLANVVTEFGRLGYPESRVLGIGILELACTIVYLIPRTSVLGAILLTGYLGGATATHVRIGDPFIFPPIFGVLLWLGLYLRDERLRALLPWRN